MIARPARFAYPAVLVAALLAAASAAASIMAMEEHATPLAKGKILPGTTWSSTWANSERGLELRPDAPSDEGNWIETPPISAGLAWRPPSFVNVSLAIDGVAPGAKPFGWAFVRFGCDAVHWSTWQAMASGDPALPEFAASPSPAIAKPPRPLLAFSGIAGVTSVAGRLFEKRRAEWRKTGPAWESDDDEYARWLLAKEPRFFDHTLPFVGWIQFRVELPSVDSAVKLTALRGRKSWSVGGMHVAPKDKSYKKDGLPWSLDLRPAVR